MGDAYEAMDATAVAHDEYLTERVTKLVKERDRLRDEIEEMKASLTVVVGIAVKQRDVLNAFVFDVTEMQLLDEMEPYIDAYGHLLDEKSGQEWGGLASIDVRGTDGDE